MQEQAIKEYEKNLKKIQEKNSWDFNKVYEEKNFWDPLEDFFNDPFMNDPFFNNDLLNQKNNIKDW
jgi:hypothetical protein